MQRNLGFLVVPWLLVCPVASAHAEFMVSSAIVEFTAEGPKQQDIELISRSKGSDYLEATVSEIVHPGQPDESRQVIEDPAAAGLLVTPDKTVLAGGGRKVLRFVLLKEPDAQEHAYRVAIKPVIKGLNTTGQVGLKILVGYEVLVIIRPLDAAPHYTAERHGKVLTVHNTGNTNILFQNGQQCAAPHEKCLVPPAVRVYPGMTAETNLPYGTPVTYSIWDGSQSIETQY